MLVEKSGGSAGATGIERMRQKMVSKYESKDERELRAIGIKIMSSGRRTVGLGRTQSGASWCLG